jgi:putative intracellular protease/amidase
MWISERELGRGQNNGHVRDGNIITSRTPNDLPEFCQEIIGALAE